MQIMDVDGFCNNWNLFNFKHFYAFNEKKNIYATILESIYANDAKFIQWLALYAKSFYENFQTMKTSNFRAVLGWMSTASGNFAAQVTL